MDHKLINFIQKEQRIPEKNLMHVNNLYRFYTLTEIGDSNSKKKKLSNLQIKIKS